MKKFVNDPYDIVDEMLEGYLEVHKHYLRRSETARTVVRTEAPVAGKVGVITGGGSGHKPSFIGFIGQGMLDAVAVGEIFTSPPPLACLETARAADSGEGVLFLLGNYAGDVMNFQLAADMARAEGVKVEQVILTDDVASAPAGQENRRRGVVGAFLVWKCTGAKADLGGSLADCKAVAEKVNARARTIGVAISPCTVPAKGSPTFTLAEDEMEYGVGHHGEAGTAKIRMMSADRIADKMTREVIDDLPFRSGDEVAVLINGLGGTPQIELYVCFRRVKQICDELGLKVERSYVGEFFTGLEMAGFSVTLLKLDQELKSLLGHPAATPAYRIG